MIGVVAPCRLFTTCADHPSNRLSTPSRLNVFLNLPCCFKLPIGAKITLLILAAAVKKSEGTRLKAYVEKRLAVQGRP